MGTSQKIWHQFCRLISRSKLIKRTLQLFFLHIKNSVPFGSTTKRGMKTQKSPNDKPQIYDWWSLLKFVRVINDRKKFANFWETPILILSRRLMDGPLQKQAEHLAGFKCHEKY